MKKIPRRLYFIPDIESWGGIGHFYTTKTEAERALRKLHKEVEMDNYPDPILNVTQPIVFERRVVEA